MSNNSFHEPKFTSNKNLKKYNDKGGEIPEGFTPAQAYESGTPVP